MRFSMCGTSPKPVICDLTFAPTRFIKLNPLLPIALTEMALPSDSQVFIWLTDKRNILVFKPQHKPLSELTTIKPTFLTTSRLTKYGCLYSGFANERCAATLRIFSAYGRDARILSCALRILEAATISIALVILRVFSTLLILVLISLLPAILLS